jgi:hypothetical protein
LDAASRTAKGRKMKFIKKWIRNLIKEAIQEGFPPIHITIVEENETQHTLHLKNGIYNKSNITICKRKKQEQVMIDGCIITQPEDGSFIVME